MRLIIITLACMLLSGCMLTKKADSCESSFSCKLEQSNNIKMITLNINESSSPIEICACRPWNKSGIRVKEGQRYIFEFTETERWKDGCVPSHPVKGWEGNFRNSIGYLFSFLKRSNKANWYALVGTADKNNKNTFAILDKASGSITIPPILEPDEEGYAELYFYANDMDGRYFNNEGSLQLKATLVTN